MEEDTGLVDKALCSMSGQRVKTPLLFLIVFVMVESVFEVYDNG